MNIMQKFLCNKKVGINFKNEVFKVNYKVSVIIPAYNAQDTLNRCLDSVFSQDFDSFEVIVVNDGSIDKTAEIAEKHSNYTNFSLINKKNGGVSRARWAGVSSSNGEYISFVDADDCIEKNMLSKMYKRAKKEDADIAVCNWKVKGAKSVTKYIYKDLILNDYEDNLNEIIFKNKDGHLWNKMFKKKILIYDIFEKTFGIRFCEDLLLCTYLITKAKKITYLSDFLYFYYENAFSITKKPSKEALFDILLVHEEIYRYCCQKKVNSYFKAQNLYATGLVMLFSYLQIEGNEDKDLSYLEQEVFNKIKSLQILNFIISELNFKLLSKIFLIKIHLFKPLKKIWVVYIKQEKDAKNFSSTE